MIILTILAFIVIFSLLILVHEWGHFAAARRAGIYVEEFGIGLPPRAKKLYQDKKGTLYSLNWIPFGGFVRMFGEDSADQKLVKDPRSFASKTILERSLVIVAGVLMNFALAWVLITIGFSVGMKPFLINEADFKQAALQGIVEETGAVLYIEDVLPGENADKAGLKKADVILKINDQPVGTLEEFQSQLKPLATYRFSVKRNKEQYSLDISTNKEGKMGFQFIHNPTYNIKEVKYPLHVALVKSAKEVGRLSLLTLKMLGGVVTSLISKLAVPEGVAGPVGIARLTYHFTQQGVMALLQFTALLSISLGVINIMPFPALDGGRFLFIIFEIILHRRPNARYEGIIHSVGFAILMLLILLITWNDIVKLIS